MSLAKKTLTGFAWTLSGRVGTRATVLIIGIVLARLLTPADFGLVAILYVFFEISNKLVASGFTIALTRQKKLTQADLSTTLYINLILSILLYVILFSSSPFIAKFFDQPELLPLTRVMGLNIIIKSFHVVQKGMLFNQFRFKIITIVELVSFLLSGIIAITLAYVGYGIWSLAFKFLMDGFFVTIGLWIINFWKPKGFINKDSFKQLFGFGSRLMLTGLLNTIFQNVYTIIIGKFFDSEILGYYNRAKVFSKQIALMVISSLEQVTIPTLSKIRDDNQRLLDAQKKIASTTSFINYPLTLGIIIIAEPFIRVVLGEQWVQTALYLQILGVSAFFIHIRQINQTYFKVIGKSDIILKISIIDKFVIMGCILVGIQFGILGVIVAKAVAEILMVLSTMYFLSRFSNFLFFDQVKLYATTALLCVPMALSLAALQYVNFASPTIKLFTMITTGAIIYILTAYIFKVRPLKLLTRIMQDRMKGSF